ncbi:hypothetical protein M407DRAFT_160373 [Tulasnella calospora MUT 4182]|uniref:Uncharacterized protein n=1 Tax=Tulasnella calospora MUT 4182 TaxID=1051891 RepID=A0A0C3PU54_9AGAM|nr:hypothetical protein M407DRAFT_160373 [Tulasnella calospora MUT 4182]
MEDLERRKLQGHRISILGLLDWLYLDFGCLRAERSPTVTLPPFWQGTSPVFAFLVLSPLVGRVSRKSIVYTVIR